jgi:N-dimethylarginine dimethylaminohydrolase
VVARSARHAPSGGGVVRGAAHALEASGFAVEAQGAPGQPDMVFPANAAVVLDGKAVLARFRYPQRRGEEAPFAAIFDTLRARGLIDSVAMLPEGCYQEGAGDCIWDAQRGHFWAGFGPRSSRKAAAAMSRHFDRDVVALELATEQKLSPRRLLLSAGGGEILYYPPAFTAAALQALPRACRWRSASKPPRTICATSVSMR